MPHPLAQISLYTVKYCGVPGNENGTRKTSIIAANPIVNIYGVLTQTPIPEKKKQL